MMLAGQMIGLPESLGYPPAKVEVTHLENGASFDVSYGNQRGLLAPFRKAALWLFTARQTAKELTSTYESLLEKYRELREETQKLKHAEQKVRESEDRYQLIADNANDIIWTMDMSPAIQYISPAVRSITGYTEAEIKTLSLRNLLTRDSISRARGLLDLVRARTGDEAGGQNTVELQLKHKDGHTVWVEIKAKIIRDANSVATFFGVARGISERKKMEGELNERESSYQAITDTAQDAIITLDKNNVITFANPASARVFGYQVSELIGKDATRLMPEALADIQLREFFSEENSEPRSNVSLKALRKDRTLIPLEMSFASHQYRGEYFRTCFIRDVSIRNQIELERKQLEQQLLASQKMESIGQLTGGIAHDFNNLLVAILGYTDLALTEDAEKQDVQQYLEEIKHAGERAADMTQKLLAFSRRQIIEPELINANNLIQGLKLMIDRLLPENINVIFDLEDKNLIVMADSGQLEQVVINLVVNARDAMPSGGTLQIKSSLASIERDFVNQKPFAREGQYIAIGISDTGTGMSEEIRKHIFEPFYTTKPEGSGTGLGLSVVFGIIKQHDGFIDLESSVGEGTSFTIYLPFNRNKPRAVTPESQRNVMGGNETIFIVEDNVQVRNLARLILIGAGYEVLEAVDGIDALKQFHLRKEEIDLVVMDVVMPRMGGKDVMERMRRDKPGIKIIFTSGYSASEIHTNFILEEGLEFISKPYSTDVLRTRVRAVLDGEKTSQSSATQG
jgi:PAS domain S-box-containing protein